MRWPLVSMDSLKSKTRYSFVGGPFGSELTTKDYQAEGVPVIRGNNLAGPGKFHDADFVYVGEEKAAALQSNLAYPGDLLFTQRGTLGQVGLIPKNSKFDRYVVSQSQMKLTVDEGKVDPLFLYYYFSLPGTTQQILNRVSSSGVPHINLSTLKAFEVPLPPKPAQQRIVSIACAYDDLVENNRQRIALLEEAVRLLYREWFVYLRFPGHEHAKIIEGLPEGWAKRPLGEITTKIGSGATPRGGEASYLSTGIPLIRSLNVYDDHFDSYRLARIGQEQASALDNVTVESQDILLNITGASVARCCMAPERHLPARVNQHVMIVRVNPNVADPFFVHAAINSDERKRQLLSYATKGATREALTKEMMAAFEITIPSSNLMMRFGEIAGTAFMQRENLAHQNEKLATARDVLLPRLVSGEVAV